MYQKSSGAYVVNLEAKNHTLEAQKDSIQRAMQKTIDECHQSALQERLDKIRQLENYNRLQDSIINKLRSIK